jgi:hypothetical protein
MGFCTFPDFKRHRATAQWPNADETGRLGRRSGVSARMLPDSVLERREGNIPKWEDFRKIGS